MITGEFFRLYFDNLEEKSNGEANVLCPFLHDKGYETRPSAHVNVVKGVFHCKTCFAEGRLESGGLSEIGFMAAVYNISYEEALHMYAGLAPTSLDNPEFAWERAITLLHSNAEAIKYLKEERGLTEDTVTEYQLGYQGDGIAYPVFIHGELCDVRTYHPNHTPKITSTKAASPLLFPFDAWKSDQRPTLLCAGENDCLLARQNGFNAVTVTAGEGSFPKIFLGLFKGKKVYVCYDCDEAGKKASRRVAFLLKEAGADVYLLDLGLEGTKQDKDITDFFMKCGHTSEDLYHLMQAAPEYDGELFQEDKNIVYPLVNLWDVPEGQYSSKRLSSRVVLSAKYDMAMRTPTAVEWECRGATGSEACVKCPLDGKKGLWTLNDKNLEDVMQLVEVNDDQQRKHIRRICGLPSKCPNASTTIKSRKSVYKVVFTPDVETEDILSGFRSVEQYAYTVGLNLEDGQRYRTFFRSYAHPLDGQRVYMIVDRAEESDNALNMFRMTDSIAEQLKVFQGDPFSVMNEKGKRMHGIPNMFSEPDPMIAATVNVVYHSPLRFKFRGNELKGYPEAAIVGESRIGKSETAKQFQRYVQIGNYLEVKGATTAALLGGADKLANGGFKIAWGVVPQNHKGLVVLDEMSGMPREVFSSLTAMRSERVATVPKIKRGKAPAETRLLWIGNPRAGNNGQSTAVKDYPNGVQLVLDLIGSDEDVARFDFFVLVVKSKQQSPLDVPELEAYPAEVYRNLIYWAWTRTSDQIFFEEGVEEYLVHVANELNEKYDTDVKFFGTEAWKKLARVAVSVAANCFSVRDSDFSLLSVRKEHVDWAATFLTRCYDNNLFRLKQYASERRAYTETNEAVNTIVAGICRTNPMVIKSLVNSLHPVPSNNLQNVSGLDMTAYRELVNTLFSHNLIYVSSNGMQATRRLKLAVDAYREDYANSKLIPLAQKDVSPV